MRTIVVIALATLSGCASAPEQRDPRVLHYCTSAMQQQTRISVGLFDARFPCIVDERSPKK